MGIFGRNKILPPIILTELIDTLYFNIEVSTSLDGNKKPKLWSLLGNGFEQSYLKCTNKL